MKRFIASFILVGVCLFSAAQSSYVSVSLERSSLSLSYSMLRSNYGGGWLSPYIPLKMSGGIDVGIFPLNVRIGMQKDPRYYLQTSLGMTFTNYVLKDESYTRVIHLPEGEIREETIYNSNKTQSNRSIGFFNLRIPAKIVMSPRWMNDYYCSFGYEGQIHFGSYYRIKSVELLETTRNITNNTDAFTLSIGKTGKWEIYFESMRTPEPAKFLFKNYGTIACTCTEMQLGMKVTIPDIKLVRK